MGVGSIGNAPSFWQQDQNYWSQQQNDAQVASAEDSLINVMGSAETNLGKGLASIANETALKRVKTQLTAAIQSLLNPSGTSSSHSIASTSSSGASGSSTALPATGTGTAPVTTSTPLLNLGINLGDSITISAGGNTTTYASTGSDTVGNLISAINQHDVGNAAITASLNRNGEIVITSENATDTITVGGVYAANIGFAVGHNTFEPTKGSSSASSSSSPPSPERSTSTSNTSGSSSSSKSAVSVSMLASENANNGASILSASGVSGSLVNMLA
jgi:hypothetical protein